PLLKVKPEEVSAALSTEDKNQVGAVERQIADLGKQRKAWSHLQVVYDAAAPTPTRILKRGQPLSPAQEVGPGIPTVIAPSGAAAVRGPANSRAGPRAGRLPRARRWTDTRAPAGTLVLRVRVNRVWQHLFGRGIVQTEDNLGVTGARPTHPELLEWLARNFDA